MLAAVTLYRRAGEDAWREVADGSRSATTAGRRSSRSTRSARTSTRSKAGSTGSRAGGPSSRRSSAPARTSPASCSRGPRSFARRSARLQAMPAARAAAAGSESKAVTVLADRAAALEDIGTPRASAWPQALSEELERLMTAHPDRSRATRFDRVLGVTVERERARFGAWYEMFPRSAGTDPSRSATFDEAAARLPYVAAMGFDVLYLPPIHPIGRSFRKGPQQLADARPERSGQPVGDRIGRGRAHGGRAGARHDRRLRSLRRGGAAARASRSRSTSRSRPRPIIPTCASIPSGSATGRTARSSTPRTRRRSTRTSIRSTSNRRTGRRSGTS